MSAPFRIGILECDRLSEALRARHGSYSDMFQRLLSSTGQPLVFASFQVMDSEYPSTVNACDAYLITGSRHSVYEDLAWVRRLQDYVVTLDSHSKKLIGICFGHQMVARALGGEVGRHPGGWGVGVLESSLVRSKSWMEPMRNSFSLIASHQDQVLRLPERAELLSGSAFCAHGSYQVGEHILCFQGHPEFTVDYARERLLARKEVIAEDTFQRALDSLARPDDATLVARWIIKFLTR
ncbi:MAG TPA: GMP synthase [Gammaproteobacteria bacterium]|nr:GMP synthase [Gammaproteobacteria bacterium]